MSQIGEQLKEARLQKGMSLEDVQEITKIRKKYLEAIETGEYKILPGSFYVRAFIKTYAETVGIDVNELLEATVAPILSSNEQQSVYAIKRRRFRQLFHEQNSSRISIFLMWAFIILISSLVYIYWTQQSASDPRQRQVDHTKFTTKSQHSLSEHTDTALSLHSVPQSEYSTHDSSTLSTEPNVVVSKKQKIGTITAFDVQTETSTPPKVTIKATGRSWLEVYKGLNHNGEKLQFDYTETDKKYVFDLTKEGLYIKSGYSSATTIFVGDTIVQDGKDTSRIQLQWIISSVPIKKVTQTDKFE